MILYIADRVIEPIPFDTVLDLTLCDGGIDYFDFSDCLADLVRTGHLTLSKDGLYAITDKGRRNSEICASSLPYSVRIRTDKNVSICNQKLRRKSQVKASTTRRPNGTYTVTLSLSDDVGSVMELDLMVPKEEMAQEVENRFRTNPEGLYSALLGTLLGDGKKT
nr:DUF4364 family protein [Dysosmobacter acutus]